MVAPRNSGRELLKGISLRNDLEKAVVADLPEAFFEPLKKYRTPAGRTFIFRCFLVAPFSFGFVGYLKREHPTWPYFVHLPLSYFLAHSRTVREMSFQNALTGPLDSKIAHATFALDEDRYPYWLERFESWRSAVDRSFWFCLERKGGVLSYSSPELINAASLGAIQNLWRGLPEAMFGRIEAELRQESESARKVFLRQAAETKTIKWHWPRLDLWLIEIWPLVLGYRWTYLDTWNVAREKFKGQPEEKSDPLRKLDLFRTHCKMPKLRLRLSREAKKGPPTREQASGTHPPLAELALQIDGFQSPGSNKTREELRLTVLK
jgi:hypothetical protein